MVLFHDATIFTFSVKNAIPAKYDPNVTTTDPPVLYVTVISSLPKLATMASPVSFLKYAEQHLAVAPTDPIRYMYEEFDVLNDIFVCLLLTAICFE